MKTRGQFFLKKLEEARPKIAKLGAPFILDGHRILTHSKSRVVLQMLKEAAKSNKRFQVFVTESHPDQSGIAMKDELLKHNISCTLILDSAMGYIMDSIDLVLVGAEGVVESGGIINKVSPVFYIFNILLIGMLLLSYRLEHLRWPPALKI